MESTAILVFLAFLFLTLRPSLAIEGSITEPMGIKLPDGLLIGVGSSAYQIEGAPYEDGKGESVIDRYCKEQPDWNEDSSNGTMACDSYHKIKEDVALLKDLGVNFFRFSISWPRITPTGDPTYINEEGIDHYHKLIDALLDAKIQPMVTMYHWDLPQDLQLLGGWTNRVVVDFFVDYARILFKEYGNKVKRWVTVNEPQLISQNGYGGGPAGTNISYPPGITQWQGFADYLSQHHMLLAHAYTYRLYEKEFKKAQRGLVGPVFQIFWMKPYSDTEKDREAARRARLFEIDSMMHPLVKGDYPSEYKRIINTHSKNEGRRISRLPSFTDEEVELIKGSFDYIGINYYSGYDVKYSENFSTPSQPKDYAADKIINPKAFTPGVKWLSHLPKDFRSSLKYLRDIYGDLRFFITENGCDDPSGLNDKDRINYLMNHLKQLILAINEDGCDVSGYTIWSFLDSYEWDAGYKAKFGLYQVDFNDRKRPRIPKKSVEAVKELMKTRIIPD
ncbi:myrosinase 1 isoform X2 [Halyomorpha halys]|uniref:myrosinase 1 isoform X2 n=1 Tax=Halyomorpha halys TaxID=286706 RepID=UPI0006D51625|nr:myrosinase 1-like isoform X1 [Halyomorpha halys]